MVDLVATAPCLFGDRKESVVTVVTAILLMLIVRLLESPIDYSSYSQEVDPRQGQ